MEEIELHGNNLSESVKDVPVVFFVNPEDGIPVIFPLPGSPNFTKDIPDLDMGKDDFPDKLQYINIKANDIPPGNEKRINELENMLDLSHKWLDIHAGLQTQTQRQKGKLPSGTEKPDRLKRDDYRIKVNDTILSEGKCPWLTTAKSDDLTYSIDVKKAEFHLELVKILLEGLSPVKGISAALEKVFESFASVILQSKNEIQNRASWAWFNVFTWDPLTKKVKGSIRIMHYNISGQVVEYVVNKSTYSHVKMTFDYHNAEYILIDSQWDASQDQLKAFLKEYGEKKIRDPVGGEIEP